MIALYDRNMKYLLTAKGFENGGLRAADGIHFITKEGPELHQNSEVVGDWERCKASGQLVVFAVDPATPFCWAELP